jgi:hypothetical protein
MGDYNADGLDIVRQAKLKFPSPFWRLKAIGHPFLALNVQKRALFVNFTDVKKNCEVLGAETSKTIVSFNQSNGSILLENPGMTTDYAICFAKASSFVRFAVIYENYSDISWLIRCLFAETDMQQRRNRSQAKTLLFQKHSRELEPFLRRSRETNILRAQRPHPRGVHFLPDLRRDPNELPDRPAAARALQEPRVKALQHTAPTE